jgi:sugar lactone lactonase YvrE
MERSIDEVVIFADGLDHPECVAIHPDGSVWAGGEAGQIYKIAEDGKSVYEVVNTGGFVLGIAFSPDAKWLAICDLKNKCVWKFDLLTGMLNRFGDLYDSIPFSIPNFPVFDREGNLYVSDSGAFRGVKGCILRFDQDGKGKVWHAGPFSFANGMALSADHGSLYVVSSWLPGVEKIDINKDGSAGERTTCVEMPETCPDGIAVDTEGNLFISCYAPNSIYRLDKNSNLSVFLHDWESHTICNPTNIVFGGSDRKMLFIANLGRWHISSIQMDTPGLNLNYQSE